MIPKPAWPLVDPSLTGNPEVRLFQQIIDLASHDWRFATQVDIASPRVQQLLARHRVWNMIPGALVPASQRDLLLAQQRMVSASQLQVQATARTVLGLLDGAGHEIRVLKGLATAELDYPEPMLRQSGDVDIAVRPNELHDAVEFLKRHGFTKHDTPYSPLLAYGVTLDAPTGVEVDIHTRLFRRSTLGDQLFASSGVALDSLPGRALATHERLVHAAGHFMLAPPGERRLSGLIDVTRIRKRADVDLDRARHFASSIGVEALVGAGLRVEASLRDTPNGSDELDRWKTPDWFERKTRLHPERQLIIEHLTRFREVPRKDWVRYLPTWLLPDRRQRELLRQAVARRT